MPHPKPHHANIRLVGRRLRSPLRHAPAPVRRPRQYRHRQSSAVAMPAPDDQVPQFGDALIEQQIAVDHRLCRQLDAIRHPQHRRALPVAKSCSLVLSDGNTGTGCVYALPDASMAPRTAIPRQRHIALRAKPNAIGCATIENSISYTSTVTVSARFAGYANGTDHMAILKFSAMRNFATNSIATSTPAPKSTTAASPQLPRSHVPLAPIRHRHQHTADAIHRHAASATATRYRRQQRIAAGRRLAHGERHRHARRIRRAASCPSRRAAFHIARHRLGVAACIYHTSPAWPNTAIKSAPLPLIHRSQPRSVTATPGASTPLAPLSTDRQRHAPAAAPCRRRRRCRPICLIASVSSAIASARIANDPPATAHRNSPSCCPA